MATIQGPRLSGSSLSIRTTEKTLRNFVSYGQATASNAQSFKAEGRRMAVLFDSTSPENVEILTQPKVGRVIARADGRISYDLNDIDYTYAGDQTFTYRRTNGGTATDVTATVTITHNERPAGWGTGDYYYMETDANDAFVVQPSETARVFHIATDGLTEADILARHNGTGDQLDKASVGGDDIVGVPARDSAGALISPTTYYGETEDLAVVQGLLGLVFQYQLELWPFRSWWFLYKRGQTFPGSPGPTAAISESCLHPTYVGAYGEGAAPKFKSTGMSANTTGSGIVFQGLRFTYQCVHQNTDFLIYDDIFCDSTSYPTEGSATVKYPMQGGGISAFSRGNTFRRSKILDAFGAIPAKSKTHWSRTNADRTSGFYLQDAGGCLIEKLYIDQSGWSPGYRSDQIGTFPKSPDDGSHGIYSQGDLYDVTMRDIIITNPSFNGIQARSGTVASRLFIAFANAGFLFGAGESYGASPDPEDEGNLSNPPELLDGTQKRATNLSYGSDIIVTEAGEKDGWDSSKTDPTDGFQAVLAGGIMNQNHATTIRRAACINGGEQGKVITSATEIGPVGRVQRASETYGITLAKVNVGASWYQPPDFFRWNWSPSYGSNSDATGLNSAALNALSTGAFNDVWKSTTGSKFADFVANLRADAAPWEQMDALLEYYQSQTGQWLTPREAATTVTFIPMADGSTPGFRSDVTDDWSTNDLPGTFAGDSIDIGDYRVFWNISPKEQINDLTIGAGGSLWMRGGDLNVAGTVNVPAGGSLVRVRGGARFTADSVTGGSLGVLVTDGRYRNTGTVSGGISVKAVCDSEALLCEPGGAFTLSSGEVLTIGGYAKAGGDGISGGTGTITLASGSKLRFQTGLRMQCAGNGAPKAMPYATITGGASGTTAIVDEFVKLNTTGDFIYKAYDLDGAFTNTETLTATQTLSSGVRLAGKPDPAAGTVTSSDVALGQLRKFRSGIHGLTPTNMVLNVAMGGTLEIDLAGYPGAISHTLIKADGLSGAFDTVSVLNLGSDRDATVTIGAATLTLTVTTGGTGRVTVI